MEPESDRWKGWDDIPQEIKTLFDNADKLLAQLEELQAIEAAIEKQRRELILLWMTVCLVAGLVTYNAWTKARRGDA